MLREVVPTRQIPNEPRRVWFIDDEMDLIAWFAEDETIIGFQLCNDKGRGEHALTWFRGKGFAYERVDDGEGRPGHVKMTPILVRDGTPDIARFSEAFRKKARQVPERLRRFVRKTLQAYPEEPPAP